MNHTPIKIWVMPSPVAHPEEQLPIIFIALVKLAADVSVLRQLKNYYRTYMCGFHYGDSGRPKMTKIPHAPALIYNFSIHKFGELMTKYKKK